MTEKCADVSPVISVNRWSYLQALAALVPDTEGDLARVGQIINQADYVKPGYSITQRLRDMADIADQPVPEVIRLIPVEPPWALMHTRCLLYMAAQANRDSLQALNKRFRARDAPGVGPAPAIPKEEAQASGSHRGTKSTSGPGRPRPKGWATGSQGQAPKLKDGPQAEGRPGGGIRKRARPVGEVRRQGPLQGVHVHPGSGPAAERTQGI